MRVRVNLSFGKCTWRSHSTCNSFLRLSVRSNYARTTKDALVVKQNYKKWNATWKEGRSLDLLPRSVSLLKYSRDLLLFTLSCGCFQSTRLGDRDDYITYWSFISFILENPKKNYAMIFKLVVLFVLIFVIWAHEVYLLIFIFLDVKTFPGVHVLIFFSNLWNCLIEFTFVVITLQRCS